jgi:ABC-type proline/glycine betaine transport system ATPase subunit
VYILDDVLSAVDAHVGKAIFFDCIMKTLKHRKKAVVLATHQVQYLQFADKVLVLDSEGRQAFFGSYEQLREQREQFSYIGITAASSSTRDLEAISLSETAAAEADEADEEAEDKAAADKAAASKAAEDAKNAEDKDDEEDMDSVGDTQPEVIRKAVNSAVSTRKPFNNSVSMRVVAAQVKKQLQGVQAEKSQVGKVSSKLWVSYIINGGIGRAAIAFFCAIMSQGSLMMADYWLKCKLSFEYCRCFDVLASADAL